jgi:hypothetical protein
LSDFFLPVFSPEKSEDLMVHVEVVVHDLEDFSLDIHQILPGDRAGDVLEEI